MSQFLSLCIMNTIQIQNLSKEELKELVQETVKEEIKNHQPKTPSGDDYLSRKETANMLGISLPTLHEWTMKGKIKAYRIGRLVRYKRAHVHSALKSIDTKKYSR